jgi:hypothetical protein
LSWKMTLFFSVKFAQICVAWARLDCAVARLDCFGQNQNI